MRRTAAGVIGVYGWVAGCRAVGQRTATENGSVVGRSLAGDAPPPSPHSAPAVLCRAWWLGMACVEYNFS